MKAKSFDTGLGVFVCCCVALWCCAVFAERVAPRVLAPSAGDPPVLSAPSPAVAPELSFLGVLNWAGPIGEPPSAPRWYDVATDGVRVYLAAGLWVHAYDRAGRLVGIFDMRSVRFAPSDKNFYLFRTGAVGGFVVTAGSEQGVVVLDTAIGLRPVYQDHGTVQAEDAAALVLMGHPYGIVADVRSGGGALVYDLAAALAQPPVCHEDSAVARECPGVFVGPLGPRTGVKRVSADGSTVAILRGPRVAELWRVGLGGSGVLRASVQLPFTADVAVWERGSGVVMATLEAGLVRLWDATCVNGGGGCSPAPIVSVAVPGATQEQLTLSRDDRDFLYVGNGLVPGGCLQREYLLDVTDPARPRSLEAGTQYWAPHYWGCGGRADFAPHSALVLGGRLYRAGGSQVDWAAVHAAQPDPSAEIFADGFESGDLGGWR